MAATEMKLLGVVSGEVLENARHPERLGQMSKRRFAITQLTAILSLVVTCLTVCVMCLVKLEGFPERFFPSFIKNCTNSSHDVTPPSADTNPWYPLNLTCVAVQLFTYPPQDGPEA